MSDLFLNLREKPSVVDFLVDNLEYADAKEREAAQKIVNGYEEGEDMHTTTLVEGARRLAKATWPARYALRKHFQHEGTEDEWKRVVATVRPSTAHLLERFRKASGAKSLDEVLKHAESDLALRDEERIEITGVRSHLRHDYWKDKQKTLAVLAKEGEREREGYVSRLNELRDLANAMPAFQDEIFSKISRMEDKILFQGDSVPMEILDDEIRYYTDQKEITPFEV